MADPDAPSGWQIGRVFGISINLHVSVVIIFFLVAASLVRLLSDWHPEWGNFTVGIYAVLAALLFFLSLLTHEMAHSIVARRRGVVVRRITLFLFGGIAEMENEPKRPQDEFFIAAAGPLASLAIAALFSLLAGALIDEAALTQSAPEFDITQLSGPVTVCLWLSTINFILAIFNLLPGFPMDGGRLFRAALWWRTNDYELATQKAAKAGEFIAYAIVAWGFYQILMGNYGGGLWTMLIGWFIRQLALTNTEQLRITHALGGQKVDALMRTRFDRVQATMPVERFIEDHLLRSKQQIWPVTEDEQDIGYIEVATLDLKNRSQSATLRDHLKMLDRDNTLPVNTQADKALPILAKRRSPIPIVDNGKIVGLLDHADVLRWLTLYPEGK